MDEVRLWRTTRTQAEILAHMRAGSGLENHPVSGRGRTLASLKTKLHNVCCAALIVVWQRSGER